ncbi:hypothetical protein NON00_23345 [Roseomonas sp. GC11]|uniref:hypothetical protein n=1 Tax=Roseomonas sp. GC11 TaxID=2950546 RepID=UPI0021088048|nr:hypothetical protein [Roseomonas sp. GC11]MCQ4162841.1 hypothetical protein [Roseomonas sp. GC11]
MDLIIQDQVMARPPQSSGVLHWRKGVPLTLSALIRERVLMEMDRAVDATGVRPLVERGATSTDDAAGRERAVTLALDGFRRNAFFVIVDDRQVTDLDATLLLKPDTAITFVRLLPLVSG